MLRKIFFIKLFISITIIGFGQLKDSEKLSFEIELSNFIESAKNESIWNGRFNVYVLKVYQENENHLCYTLSYIINSYSYNEIKPDYYFMFEENYILVKIEEEINKNMLFNMNLNTISNIKMIEIVQKLYPSDVGYTTNIYSASIFCMINNEIIEVVRYENSDNIPKSKSIYSTFPSNTIIREVPLQNIKRE
jgi:hypothetical protein